MQFVKMIQRKEAKPQHQSEAVRFVSFVVNCSHETHGRERFLVGGPFFRMEQNIGNEVNGDSEDVEALTSCGGQKHLLWDLLNEVRKTLTSSWARRGRSNTCKFADRSKLNILKISRALDALEESHFTPHTVMIPKGHALCSVPLFFFDLNLFGMSTRTKASQLFPLSSLLTSKAIVQL